MGRIQKTFTGILIIALFFALWEIASRLYWVNPAFVPPFTNVVSNIYRMFLHRNMAYHIAMSLYRSAVGVAIGTILGVPLGFLLAAGFEKLRIALGSLADILAQVNPFVLFHVLILFLGVGEAAKITIVVWACIWPVMFNTVAGVENIDRTLLRAGLGFGGSPLDLFFKVILPAAAPKIFTGIRISAGYALFILIAAEMMGGRSGLGWMIGNEQTYFRIENIFSLALVIAVLGILVDGLLQLIQRRLIPGDMQQYMNSLEA
jgi:NitT/TauT family transport system permease protein